MKTYVTFDGDEYCVALPPKNFCYRIEQLIKQKMIDQDFSPNQKYLVCEKLEAEALLYNIGAANGDSMIEQKLVNEDGTATYIKAPDEAVKQYQMQIVGFRPCLVPVGANRLASPLSRADNPSGTVVEGGRLRLGSKIFHRKNLPDMNHQLTIRTKFDIVDSDVSKENLSWVVIDGFLVCSDVLFYATEYVLHKKNLISTYACEASFFRDLGLNI